MTLLFSGFFSHLYQATAQSTHSCGAPNVHNPALLYDSLTDQDGNKYKTISIGNRKWMAENLKTSKYRNGQTIPLISLGNNWQNLVSGAFCWYNNDSANYHCPYGKLYNWYAVTDPRNLCPSGWHVPTDEELNELETALGGSEIAGDRMKNAGNQYFTNLNETATNGSGFSGLPGGFRLGSAGGEFMVAGSNGFWWTSSLGFSNTAVFYNLVSDYGTLIRSNYIYRCGLSVRCVSDQTLTENRSLPALPAFRIFPNPFHDRLTIEIPEAESQVPYFLLDVLGKEIQKGWLQGGKNQISMGQLPEGIYYLKTGSQSPRVVTLIRE